MVVLEARRCLLEGSEEEGRGGGQRMDRRLPRELVLGALIINGKEILAWWEGRRGDPARIA